MYIKLLIQFIFYKKRIKCDMEFLSTAILEIFIYLLYQKETVEIDSLRLSCKDLNKLFENDSKKVIECSEHNGSTIINLKNKKQLIKFLQKYINNYKKENLKLSKNDLKLLNANNEFRGYLSYKDNLSYVIKILEKKAKSQNTFILYSNELPKNLIDGKLGRFLELILEICFQNYIEIIKCNFKKTGLLWYYKLEINIKLLKTFDEIDKALSQAYRIYDTVPNLTDKEKEVLNLILKAYSTSVIADNLISKKTGKKLSTSTVEKHINSILKKTKLADTKDLLVHFLK